MAITNPGIFKRTNYKYTASSITINQPVSGSDIAFWDNPETTTYSSRYSQSDTALSSGIRGDSPVTEAMDIDWRPYKILTQRPGNINGYQYLATTTDLLMSLNANYVELKDAVSNAQTSANTISYSLSTTGKVVTLSGSNPSSSLTFGGDNWINIAGPANATLTGKLTFTHGTPNIANNTGTTKGGGTSEIITKITYDSKGHIADVVKGTLTTEKLETDGNGKVVKQVVLDGYKLKVAYTNTITNATNATNATNVDLLLKYDTSTGINVQAGNGTAGTLKATLAQGSDHDKVILQLGESDAGSEVTINDVAHATSADSVAITASYVAGTSGAGKGLSIQGGSGTADVVPFKLATSGSGSSAKIGLRIDNKTAGSDITVPFATEATNLTNKPSLSYDGGLKVTAGGKTSDPCYFGLSYSSGGLKLRVGSTDISTLQVRLLQGGSNDKVKLKIGSTDTGEVTINNVEIASKIKTVKLSGETGLDPSIIQNYYDHLPNTTSNKKERKGLTNYLKNETVQKSIFWLTPSTYSINNGTAIYESFAYNNYIKPNSNEYMLLSSNAPHIIYSGGQVFMFTPFTISAEIWSENIHGNNFHGTLFGNADTATSATSATNVNLSLSYSTSTGLTVQAGTGTAGVVPFKLTTSGSGSSAKIGLRIGGNKAGSDITVPYATTAGSADSATTAGSATNAENAEKVLINTDQYDTLNPGTVEDAVIKLAEQDDPAPMEQLRAANFGITPVVFASNEKSSKYIFESGANNSLWSNPLTSQASLTNNGPFILHNNDKPDILYSQVIGANKIYGKEFTGNAATATSATTAAGFTGTVSLQNASNQLKVTVGSTTSSGLTIAYATNAGNADTVDGYHILNRSPGSSPDANTIYIVT